MKLDHKEVDLKCSNGTRIMITDYGPSAFTSVHVFQGDDIVATIYCHTDHVDLTKCVPEEGEQ